MSALAPSFAHDDRRDKYLSVNDGIYFEMKLIKRFKGPERRRELSRRTLFHDFGVYIPE